MNTGSLKCRDCKRYTLFGCGIYYELENNEGKTEKVDLSEIMSDTFPNGHKCEHFQEK